MLKKFILRRCALHAVALFFSLSPLTFVHAITDCDRGMKIYSRLTGVGIHPSKTNLIKQIEKLSHKKAWDEIATLATSDPNFIDILIRDFAAEMSNRPLNPVTPLNDLTALIMGIARDDKDARTILYTTNRYVGAKTESIPAPSLDSNEHYLAMDKARLSPHKTLVTEEHPYGSYAAGILTTRAWMESHMAAGTNRRAAEFLLQVFACAPIMTYKDTDLGDGRVRKDVDRAPNGNSNQYDKDCRGCHAPMDAFAGAFAKLDFVDGKPLYEKTRIATKYFNLSTDKDKTGKEIDRIGYSTTDDSWINQLQEKSVFGWEDAEENSGNGPQSLGKLIAHSKSFATCMASKAFRKVCRQEPVTKERLALVANASANFSRHHQFKKLFADIAGNSLCTEGGSAVSLRNFREAYEHLINRSEITPTVAIAETYNNEVSKLAKIGTAAEFTEIMQSAYFKLGASFCKAMADKRTEDNSPARKVFEALAAKFWSRPPTDDEMKVVDSRMAGLPGPNRWLSICVATVTSPQTIVH